MGGEEPEVTEREAGGETGGDDKERQQEALQRYPPSHPSPHTHTHHPHRPFSILHEQHLKVFPRDYSQTFTADIFSAGCGSSSGSAWSSCVLPVSLASPTDQKTSWWLNVNTLGHSNPPPSDPGWTFRKWLIEGEINKYWIVNIQECLFVLR